MEYQHKILFPLIEEIIPNFVYLRKEDTILRFSEEEKESKEEEKEEKEDDKDKDDDDNDDDDHGGLTELVRDKLKEIFTPKEIPKPATSSSGFGK